MSAKRTARREDLRMRLVDAADALIAEQGLAGLRARDIAERAGCALGGLYTVFADLDDLILHVNSRTLGEMEKVLTAAAEQRGEQPAFEALALAYLRFAREKARLWSALFEHRMPEGVPVPDWHLQEHVFLVGLIIEPLSALMPSLSRDALISRAKTLFAAVHGVIALSLDNRYVGLPSTLLEEEVRVLARALAIGLKVAFDEKNRIDAAGH